MQTKNIPGTIIFDGTQAVKGYGLNKMCWSFNQAANREDFLRDEDAYCRKFDLNDPQRQAVRSRDILALVEEGGNINYVAKFAGIFGWNVQTLALSKRA
jgi:protocatechuate 4,5-dioxygenase alpha chain